MRNLHIPEQYRIGIRTLAELPPEKIEALYSALEQAAPRLRPHTMVEEIAAALSKDFSRAELQRIIEALSSFSALAEDVSLDQVVADLIESMQADPSSFPEPTAGWEDLRSRLLKLLNVRSLRISSKADDVQHEHPNVFTTARILSDIRLVFSEDAKTAAGGLIIHELKITYFADGEYRDIYIAMDNADIKTLRAILDRAEEKTDVLAHLLSNASVPYFKSE